MDARFYEIDTRMESLREREARLPKTLPMMLPLTLRDEFRRRLEISWIYHDSALEGVVLSYSEIKAAIDTKIISDVSLIPSYEEIKRLKEAMAWANDYASQRKRPVNVDVIRKLYSFLVPEEASKGLAYRKDNPLHRLYYHEIAPPDKIAPRMKKLQEWLEEEGTRRIHPVERAARAHWRLMNTYPWTKHSGRLARVLTNLMLVRDGYLPAIVHSIDRQRYYECLRAEGSGIVPLYVEAEATAIETAVKFYDETAAATERLQKNRRAAS